MIVILKCYYEIIYLEIVKLFGNSKNHLVTNKFAYYWIYVSFCLFVDNQFMIRLGNSIKSKFFIILLSILKYTGYLELWDVTDIGLSYNVFIEREK